MNKTELLNKFSKDPEERVALARALDQMDRAANRSIPCATQFLSPAQRAALEPLIAACGHPRHLFHGGFEGAERTLCVFLPDWQEPDDWEAADELAAIECAYPPTGAELTHRDLLGGLMGIGLTRERVGDILVSPHSADIVAAPPLREFFLREWDQAGRVKLTVTEIGREALCVPQTQVKVIRDTVSSLRLDAVTATAFSMSRGRAAELIAAGKVSLDHVPCLKGDKPVGEGAVITARGLGKARLAGVGGLSKKGRTGITVERYI